MEMGEWHGCWSIMFSRDTDTKCRSSNRTGGHPKWTTPARAQLRWALIQIPANCIYICFVSLHRQHCFECTLAAGINQLGQERVRLAARLHGLTEAISALTGVSANRRGRISSAGRARIAAAQRARWVNAKGERGVSSARRKRTLSTAAIARIRAAQKQRWAKWRKQQQAA